MHLFFSAANYWFWVPIVAPHLGAVLGSFLYDFFIALHWPDDEDDVEKEELVITKINVKFSVEA